MFQLERCVNLFMCVPLEKPEIFHARDILSQVLVLTSLVCFPFPTTFPLLRRLSSFSFADWWFFCAFDTACLFPIFACVIQVTLRPCGYLTCTNLLGVILPYPLWFGLLSLLFSSRWTVPLFIFRPRGFFYLPLVFVYWIQPVCANRQKGVCELSVCGFKFCMVSSFLGTSVPALRFLSLYRYTYLWLLPVSLST